jgi:tetratricopeptide (TPR) repeat protein
MSLEQAQDLVEQGDYEGGWKIIKRLMEFNPMDAHLLIAASYIMQKVDNWPVSYHFSKASAISMPDRAEPYLNISACCDQMYLLEEGLEAAKKAVELADTPRLKASALMNHASILINNGRYGDAEPIIRESLKINPDSQKARGNLGMCLLARGEWLEGWKNYSQCLGLNERKKLDYGLPEWDGEPGQIVVYGEQGLGDEISFASMLPDVIADHNVVVDCDHRLEGLFKRSFPKARVNGGRWRNLYQGANYQCAIGELGKFYRNTKKDFPRKPYLVADPLRRAQWKHLKEQVKKPLIGIAWTGGMSFTGAKHRQLTKAQLMQITQGIDAHFVSLEYKEREKVNNVHVYPHATLTRDYDDTAALVAECDLVISIQTAVCHLAGALGTPCIALIPESSQWRYAPKEFLWYSKNFEVVKAPWNLKNVISRANQILIE